MSTIVKFKDKDEEDGNIYMMNISINFAENGWIVNSTDQEGEEAVAVYQTRDGKDLLRYLKDELGINND